LSNKDSDDKRSIRRYLNIPVQMLVIIGTGVFGGIQLDKLFKLNFPVFALILAGISIFVAIYITIKDLLK